MKIIIIAVYLAAGSSQPELRWQFEPTLADCQAKAARYVAGVKSGSARAWCERVRVKEMKS